MHKRPWQAWVGGNRCAKACDRRLAMPEPARDQPGLDQRFGVVGPDGEQLREQRERDGGRAGISQRDRQAQPWRNVGRRHGRRQHGSDRPRLCVGQLFEHGDRGIDRAGHR